MVLAAPVTPALAGAVRARARAEDRSVASLLRLALLEYLSDGRAARE